MPFSVYSDLSRSLSSVQFDYMHYYLSVVILRSRRKTTYTGRRKRFILLCFI